MKKNYDNIDDYQLYLLLIKGKPESDDAFKVIYKRYSGMIHAYCYKILNNKAIVDDIFQETFINFYQNIKKDMKQCNIRNYLFTIARNLCLNQIRNSKVTLQIDEYHLFVNKDEIEEHEQIDELNKAINTLDLEYREPLILRLYDGLNYQEIADLLHISCETARQRVFRAKDKLKNLLKPINNIKKENLTGINK